MAHFAGKTGGLPASFEVNRMRTYRQRRIGYFTFQSGWWRAASGLYTSMTWCTGAGPGKMTVDT